MRNSCKTWFAVAAMAVATVFAGSRLHAGDDEDEDDDAAATAAIAKEALDKSVVRGNELFRSKALGKKSCASCHEDPEKPNLKLSTRPAAFSYPRYSTKKKVIVTMGQKINEMLSGRSRGKEMDLASADIVALEAYVMSLKAPAAK